MKTKVFSLFFLLSFGVNVSSAQEGAASESAATDSLAWKDWNIMTGPKIIKFSPFDVLSYMPTFGTDVEVRLGQSHSLQGGLAFIPNVFQVTSREGLNQFDRINGYRIRTEGRLYMPRVKNNYFAVGVSFRHLIITNEVAIGMEPSEGQFGQQEFAYFINTPMTFHRFNTHLDLKIGTQSVLNSGFAIDLYFGLSFRNIRVMSNSEIPIGGAIPDDRRGMWEMRDGHRLTYPLPIIGLKMGFGSDGRP